MPEKAKSAFAYGTEEVIDWVHRCVSVVFTSDDMEASAIEAVHFPTDFFCHSPGFACMGQS